MTRDILDNANYPDEIQLKAEIDEISSRIDRIIETVREHFPGNTEQTDDSETDGNAERQDER
ncbi:MAG: hypothetical protein R6T92_07150 [Desulfosalsimonadaceae bacterium]